MTLETIPHVLACDCGNSRIRLAHIQGEDVQDVRTFHLGELAGLGEAITGLWNAMPTPKRIVAASVNPAALRALEAAALEAADQDVLVVGRDLPLPIDTDVDARESVGTDRLCAASAAFDRLGSACVIADFGTAITIDCVNGEGVFLGGVIMPGLRMSAGALAERTAQLPDVDVAVGEPPEYVYGKTTEQAIFAGLVYGARGALRERVEAYATDLGAWPLVILTGGDAKLVSPHTGQDDFVQAVVDDLTLRGVAMAFYRGLIQE
ncbi:MAG: type III pantothenate kinase [Bacteroidetes bacterium]|jgi:type III pantothenate kinase|nr:type III pantothenate kinase [Bacteroidota bacterium]